MRSMGAIYLKWSLYICLGSTENNNILLSSGWYCSEARCCARLGNVGVNTIDEVAGQCARVQRHVLDPKDECQDLYLSTIRVCSTVFKNTPEYH